MQVYNNVPAFGVWVNYTNSVANMRSSMSRMSSGLRIMSAGDDPAGLAMSERMRSQIRNSSMAAQNIQNQQAYVRTADSWMQKLHDLLHRMSELSVAANDGTKTDVDRSNLQAEFAQLQEEIIRITSGSLARGKFNSKALFQGGSHTIQVGADPGQWFCGSSLRLDRFSDVFIGTTYTQFSCGQFRLGEPVQANWSMIMARGGQYGIDAGIHISTAAGAARAGALIALAVDHLSRQRAIVGAEASRLTHTLEGVRTYEENIRSAESQIRDVDMALESTNFAKYQILTQVGTAMLAQANALTQNVLQLLG
ncbi:MAG: flagellin [Lentisphaerae bacterium]|nr:flagellin [Lentisphaerota bacterium]